MVRAKIESGQIQKMFMIKLTGFGDTEIRKGDCGWLGTEDLEGEETDSLWEAAKKEINPDNNNKSQVHVQMRDWLRVPGKEGEPSKSKCIEPWRPGCSSSCKQRVCGGS